MCELETTGLPSGHSLQFSQQFDTLLQHGTQILCGPNTPTNFMEFSLKTVTEEFNQVHQMFISCLYSLETLIETPQLVKSLQNRRRLLTFCPNVKGTSDLKMLPRLNGKINLTPVTESVY